MTDNYTNETDGPAERMLWLQFDVDDQWTQEELDAAAKAIHEALPTATQVVLTPDSIDTLSRDEVDQYVQQLIEVLDE